MSDNIEDNIVILEQAIKDLEDIVIRLTKIKSNLDGGRWFALGADIKEITSSTIAFMEAGTGKLLRFKYMFDKEGK